MVVSNLFVQLRGFQTLPEEQRLSLFEDAFRSYFINKESGHEEMAAKNKKEVSLMEKYGNMSKRKIAWIKERVRDQYFASERLLARLKSHD